MVLATDIVASTPLGKRIGEDVYRRVIAAHHRLLRDQIAACQGRELKETGDGFWVAFSEVDEAVLCAQSILDAVEATNRASGFAGHPLDIRMAVHITNVTREDGDYRGLGLHDVARLLSASNGGQVLLSEIAALLLQAALPAGITLGDCGRYLLRDAPGPVRLFEALWQGMPGAGSVRPLPVAPPEREPRLPTNFTRFFGRETERERIAHVLEGGARLVTLTGMGGSGKTRLAVEAARALAPRFGGAVWFVPLAAVSDPNRILEAVRIAVGVSEGGEGFSGLDPTLSSGPCLLVLDNLEHLQVADAVSVDRFLQEALGRYSSLVLLCTSRHRLGLSQEQEITLRPFSLPSPGGRTFSAEQARTWPSVALFEDRACRSRSDFAITDANADAVVKLCRRLEGLPLALELAAAWARLLTPTEMLARVSDIRRGRDRDLPERHRSLQAVLESSYRLLNEEQQRVFRALSVFRGGWTVAAAERVCDDPFALDLLADLSEHSLIVSEEGDEGAAERFTFLESVREFAESCLKTNPAEAEIVAARHIGYFADLAQEAEPYLKGPTQAEWLSRLAGEQPNLFAALDRADAARRVGMAVCLYRFWVVRGYRAEGIAFLADLEKIEDLAVPTQVKSYNIVGALAQQSGNLDKARQYFSASRDIAESHDLQQAAALTSLNLAMIACQQGRFLDARRDWEISLEQWRQEGEVTTLASVLTNLGAVCVELQDFAAARSYLEECLNLPPSSQDSLVRASALQNLSESVSRQGDNVSALRYASECLSLRILLQDQSEITNLLVSMAFYLSRNECLDQGAMMLAIYDTAVERMDKSNPIPPCENLAQYFNLLSSVRNSNTYISLIDDIRKCEWTTLLHQAQQLMKRWS